MKDIENRIRAIFRKDSLTDRDVAMANDLLSQWKELSNWQEDTSCPIKA